jgi:glycine betaine/proline transport system permease protein
MQASQTLAPETNIPWKPILYWAAVVAVGVAVSALVWRGPDPASAIPFPKDWNFGLRAPIDNFQTWVIANRTTHPLFALTFDPLDNLIDFCLIAVEDFLVGLPWFVLVIAVGLLAYYLGGWRLVAVCVGGLLFCGLTGLWQASMQTLALMGMSVFISLLIGVPLGVYTAHNPRFEAFIKPILDGMQTMPAFVYLIPVILFFSAGRVSGVVSTVVFALPPAIRLTALGVKQVLPSALEAGQSFGSTPRQLLYKVELPLALPAIMAGVNQTIMMALGIVVIASLVGASGLGREVTNSLARLKVGDGFEAGMAIVFLAILLDRLSDALSKHDFTGLDGHQVRVSGRLELPARWLAKLISRFRRDVPEETALELLLPHAFLVASAFLVIVLVVASIFVWDTIEFPEAWNLHLDAPVDAVVAWMRDNLFRIGGLPIGTGPLSDFLTLYVMNPLRDLFSKVLPWQVIVLAMAALAYTAGGWRLGLLAGAGMLVIGFLGMWEPAMDTLSQILVAILLTILLAVPLGVLTSRSDRAQAVLRPILDTLQTIPPFVYLIPVIMLFAIGRVPGLIASVLYALPPGIKLVDLGIRQVPGETVEAAKAFGSTETQTLVNVKLPLALPAILVGVNQMIMMVLSMVVISGMVGGKGLGLEAVTGLARSETGLGIEAGLAIVALAIVIDRITQAWAAEK